MLKTTLIVPWTSAITRPVFTSVISTISITHVWGPRGGAPHEGHAKFRRCACVGCGHVVHRRSFFFFGKGVVRVVQTAPSPFARLAGFGVYINSALKTSMVRPRWAPLVVVAGN